MSLEVPVWEQMQGRLVRPPRFQIPRLILPEAAVVENTKLRIGGRVFQRVRFATVVESRPIEHARSPGTVGIELPAALNPVDRSVIVGTEIQRAHVSRCIRRIEIDAARPASSRLFRSHNLPSRVRLLTVIDIILKDIVESHHVKSLDHLRTAGIGYRRMARRVKKTGVLTHGCSDTRTLHGVLHPPLLITVTP